MRKFWKISLQVGFCLLLLTYLSHKIFVAEGKMAFEQHGGDWNTLSQKDQWINAWTFGPQEMVHAFGQIRTSSFILALAMTWVMIFLGVVRWRMVLRVQGLNLSLRHAMKISLVAQFFSAILLGSVGGDLIKAYYAARETHHKKTEAVVTVLVDRLIGMWAMLLFAGIMMIPNLGYLRHLRELNPKMAAVELLVLAMLAGSTLALFIGFWGGISRQLPQARVWLRKIPKGDMIERSLDACRNFGHHPGFIVKSVALSLIVNVFVVLQMVVLADGMGLNIPPLAMFVTAPMVVCIAALPITPGGLGPREYLYVVMLAGIGIYGATPIPGTAALCLSLLAFAASLAWSVIGGFVYMGMKHRENLVEVTHDSGNESDSPSAH